MNIATEQKKGFTLIEVVLVLAIAGLIFLIVFLALPALQRSQRDTQRKQDLSRFMSQLTNYSSNKNGSVPTDQSSLNSFVAGYLTNSGQTFKDPTSDATYNVTFKGSTVADKPTNIGEVFYYKGAKCDDNGNPTTSGAGGRSLVGAIKLEQGDFLCQDNS